MRIATGWTRILAPLMILSLLITGCQQEAKDKTIAEVNGDPITQSQYDQHYRLVLNYYEQQVGELDETKDKEIVQGLRDSSYEDLIIQKLVWQEAEKRNIKIDEKQVDQDLKVIRDQKNQQEKDGYEKFLEENQIDEAFLRQEWKTQNLYMKLLSDVTKDEKVSDAEVQSYYQENQKVFAHEAGLQIYHILVETKEQAEEVLDKLGAGQSFADLAAQYSLDPGSRNRGGDVGIINEQTNFVKEFKDAALTLKPGELYPQPVKTEFGYHIIQAGEQLKEGTWSLETVSDDIRSNILQSKQQQAFNQFLEESRNGADIKDFRKA